MLYYTILYYTILYYTTPYIISWYSYFDACVRTIATAFHNVKIKLKIYTDLQIHKFCLVVKL